MKAVFSFEQLNKMRELQLEKRCLEQQIEAIKSSSRSSQSFSSNDKCSRRQASSISGRLAELNGRLKGVTQRFNSLGGEQRLEEMLEEYKLYCEENNIPQVVTMNEHQAREILIRKLCIPRKDCLHFFIKVHPDRLDIFFSDEEQVFNQHHRHGHAVISYEQYELLYLRQCHEPKQKAFRRSKPLLT